MASSLTPSPGLNCTSLTAEEGAGRRELVGNANQDEVAAAAHPGPGRSPIARTAALAPARAPPSVSS